MTRNELKIQIENNLKAVCALPYSLNSEELDRIIDLALKWFYQNYKYAVEQKYYIIPRDFFQTDELFKSDRSIILPDCVISVIECKEVSGANRLLNAFTGEFSGYKLLASEIYTGGTQMDLPTQLARLNYWDLTRALFLNTLAYSYNFNTNKLMILGRTPTRDVFLNTYVKIDEEKLYEDWYFIRYVVAQAKISLGSILTTFTYNLPGGVTINGGEIKADGKEELTNIIQEINDMNKPDWFFMFN